jgi:drug/metabolite transporter (DMT)-like permease
MEFLMRMSPLAALQALACGVVTGELKAFCELVTSGEISVPPTAFSLTGNGFLALLLNISSFNTNKIAGALTMTVCGNLKQCLTVALGIFLFDIVIDWLNGVGMGITMIGAAIYSKAELDNKKKKQQPQQDDIKEEDYLPVQQTPR